MRTLSTTQQLAIAVGLAVFMVVTRSPQIPGSALLHSGSWAVFFAAGVYIGGALILPVLLALAFAIDAVAVGWGGISAYCLTPAYAMLLPAYGGLFAAGRWYARQHRFAWATLAPLAGAACAGAIICEVFASGGFYWLSGRFIQPTIGAFVAREAQYFPAYLATLVFWLAVAVLTHSAVVVARGRDRLAAGSATS